jgi:TonB family protein
MRATSLHGWNTKVEGAAEARVSLTDREARDLGNCNAVPDLSKLLAMTSATQRCPRTKMVLPLRVWLDGQEGESSVWHWAHTLDISHIGCRLGGLREQLTPGETIALQRGQAKANFRVVWSAQVGERESQAGIEAFDYGHDIWGVELPPSQFASKPAAESEPAVAQVKLKPAQASLRTQSRNSVPLRKRWAFSLGALFVLIFGLWFIYQASYRGGSLEILAQVPSAPSDEDLAPRRIKARPVENLLAKALDPSVPVVQVAEAPVGHVAYPVAPEDGTKGKVRLQIVVAENGFVKKIHALSGDRTLAEAAARAVRLWHYTPFTPKDEIADRETTVTVDFVGTDAVSLEFPNPNAQVHTN